jgi:hypothetical protein
MHFKLAEMRHMDVPHAEAALRLTRKTWSGSAATVFVRAAAGCPVPNNNMGA